MFIEIFFTHVLAPVAFAEGAHEGREAHARERCAAAVIRRQREPQGVDAHAALATLAHDCRRPELFRPHLMAAIEIVDKGYLTPQEMRGAWAGEIGQVQMLPKDILENGMDGDGDGHVLLKTSAPDALVSGAKMLASLGWRYGEPWLQEVVLPANLGWSLTGLETTMTVAEWERLGVAAREGALDDGRLEASILLPQGRGGPAFMAYPNFRVYFEWNQSFTYVMTAAYFATRLEGAPVYDAGNPDPGLDDGQLHGEAAGIGDVVGACPYCRYYLVILTMPWIRAIQELTS